MFPSLSHVLTHDNDIAILSVCQSVTFRYSVKTVEHIVIISSPQGRPIIRFMSIKQFPKIPTGSPLAGVLNMGWVKKFVDFRPISRYILQTIQDSP